MIMSARLTAFEAVIPHTGGHEMNEYSQLIKHPDISLSPISDGIGVGNPATGEILAFIRKTDSDKLKNLIQKAAAAQKLWAAKTALERADVLWRWYF